MAINVLGGLFHSVFLVWLLGLDAFKPWMYAAVIAIDILKPFAYPSQTTTAAYALATVVVAGWYARQYRGTGQGGSD
ncbi:MULTISPECIES: hypothetical protein [Halorussus]|uniref:hypothetical protein n=1 Tax=Halorussus TaxID=1070314 RepID=UPI0020A1C029|nr:hypothetical protein [Halorussus vallis]USZ78645.1 hypothetical protein NGM07_25180 [Halorussus vallis]USZ78676.1 hypothetical protein NGM07_24510 [Halorussus vallis]